MLTPISRILNVWRVVSLARFSTEPKCAFWLFQNCSVTKTLRVSEFIELANVYKSYDPIRSDRIRETHLSMHENRRERLQDQEHERSWKAWERESIRLPTFKFRVQISCSKEIRQCLWTTALSLAGLVKKTSHCMWNGVFFPMLRCSYCLFFSLARAVVAISPHSNIWPSGSELRIFYAYACMMLMEKAFGAKLST